MTLGGLKSQVISEWVKQDIDNLSLLPSSFHKKLDGSIIDGATTYDQLSNAIYFINDLSNPKTVMKIIKIYPPLIS